MSKPREVHSENSAASSESGLSGISPDWLAAGALILLVAAVFFPVLSCEFINLDLATQVHDNPYVQRASWDNLTHICTRPCPASYYPVRTLTYLIDCQIWGLNPFGFKLTNLLLHAANVLLVYGILLRLVRHRADSPATTVSRNSSIVAGLGAGIFAVHPVVVEAVAWVPGREELLMTLGALACFHFHLTAARRVVMGEPARRVWPYHMAAAVACGAACLSNAVGAIVPLLIGGWDLIMLPRHTWKRIAGGTLPLWLFGIGTVVLKRLTDAQNPYALDQPVTLWRNLLTLPKIFWLNLKTLVWPTQLTLDYWDFIPEGLTDPPVVLGLVAAVAFALLLWKVRGHKLVLFGLVWFCLALGPTSQIIPHHILRADRFLYLPLVGLAIALAMAARRLLPEETSAPAPDVAEAAEASAKRESIGKSVDVAAVAEAAEASAKNATPRSTSPNVRRVILCVMVVAASVVLLSLSLLSRQQLQTWRNSVTVWRQCLEVSPRNAVGLGSLADALAETGRFDLAIPKFEQSLRLDPGNAETMNSYGYRLAMSSRWELRNYGRAIELLKQANEIVQWKSPKYRRTLSMAYMNLATDLNHTGRVTEAIEHFRLAIATDPKYEAPKFNLALVLVSCGDQQLRDVEEGIRVAEEACRATEQPNSLHLSILANVYQLAGRKDRALEVAKEAVQRAELEGDTEMLSALQDQVRTWEQP